MPASTTPSLASRQRPTPYSIPASASTSEFIPSPSQANFRLIGDHSCSLASLGDSDQTAVLQKALQVAKAFVWSPLGLDITHAALMCNEPPREKGAPAVPMYDWTTATLHPDKMKSLEDFKSSTELETVVNTKTKDYAFVDTDEPTTIHIQYALVAAGGKAYSLREAHPDVAAGHILFLAVTLAHELQHVIRLASLGLLHDTPPSLWDLMHSRPAVLKEKDEKDQEITKEVIWGEGEYYFETAFLGGRLDAYLKDHPLFEDQIDYLGISFMQGGKRYSLQIPPIFIRQLVDTPEQCADILPLTRHRSKAIEGYLSGDRLREREPEPQVATRRIVNPNYFVNISPSPSPKKAKAPQHFTNFEDKLAYMEELKVQHRKFAPDQSLPVIEFDGLSDDRCGTKRLIVGRT
ncbi:hypothetical protein I204_05051 [Kwoniella mangroviensis CBS 8886]|nr:hypothetical protein I204_05051 [Kwoniella mangroviensis CBS 8886]